MAAGAADQRTQQLTDRLLAAFEGSIPRVRRSPLYLAGLVPVALLIVLLPLIYVGLIALVGYGIYFHAVNSIEILDLPAGPHGRASAGILMLKLISYFAPLLVGVILLIFMVKPFFARSAAESGASPSFARTSRCSSPLSRRLCRDHRGPAAQANRRGLRHQRGRLLPSRPAEFPRPRPGSADRGPAGGRADPSPVCRRACPRVRTFQPGHRHAADLHHRPCQRLVRPCRL